ncbi:YqcI/YcgG family protein [Heyndrickxia acidicola]|uniref:YqcI/YcgG family protein n=1 Tax=Heyndrickxia acidicola TaxID=209389 RepID=A0ABU6ML60_9BACI|nr:YqcI/YcgG family protein [Heyndrickxia acidicola]MED1205421.1 YqcI/YcgG family protein [Heyndrickxia acidicola]
MKIKSLYTDSPHNRKCLHAWKRNVLEKFEAIMNDKVKPFPCIPATIGFNLNQFRYGFTGDPSEITTQEEVNEMLREFTIHCREFGPYTSLIIFYQLPDSVMDTYTVENFEGMFWQQLRVLAKMDEREWPYNIPGDPHSPAWEFCFNGEPYFMYCATPSHLNRKSRHFDCFMLAVTPRWVLNEFNRSQSHAARIKSQVRRRLSNYDAIPIHPDLNSYGNDDNFEWRQYFLRDDDSTLSKCPFYSLEK